MSEHHRRASLRGARLWWLLLPAMTVLCLGCRKGTLYHRYVHIPTEGWGQTDTIRFHLPAVSADGCYSIELAMRHGNDFPYRSIWMGTEIASEEGRIILRDTLCLNLTDEQGTFTGRGITILQCRRPLAVLRLRKGEETTVSIFHIMAREILPDIYDIGVKVSDCTDKTD